MDESKSALLAALERIEELAFSASHDLMNGKTFYVTRQLSEIQDRARAAIAAAEGREP